MNLRERILALILATALSTGVGCGRSEKVSDITSPDYWLENYRWFKQQRSAIEQVDHTIQNHRTSINEYKKELEGTPRIEWPRHIEEGLQQRETEANGYIRQYNSLVAQYNTRASDITRRLADTRVDTKFAYMDSVENMVKIQYRQR